MLGSESNVPERKIHTEFFGYKYTQNFLVINLRWALHLSLLHPAKDLASYSWRE